MKKPIMIQKLDIDALREAMQREVDSLEMLNEIQKKTIMACLDIAILDAEPIKTN